MNCAVSAEEYYKMQRTWDMKVVQINTFSYKAAGNIMMNLHKAMLEKGIDSYVAWGRGRKTGNNHEFYMNDDIGIRLHGIYTRITDKAGFASQRSTRKLLDWIDGIDPDIIHLHCLHGYYINIELLFDYIRAKNKKVIWTQHDCWAFTGHCAYFDAVGCEKWKTGCHGCVQKGTYPVSKLMDNSKENWDRKKQLFTGLDMTIVTPSKWLANLVKQSFLKEYPVKVIYNGIDISVFRPCFNEEIRKKYSPDGKPIVLGVASEWTERKGLPDFVALAKGNPDIHVVVVGVTPKQIKHLPDCITALQRTNNVQELVELYSVADLFFNPTYEDNLPTTNLEAIACGTPVVTYPTGGSVEPINNRNGAIVRANDFVNVLTCIKRVNRRDGIALDSAFVKETMVDQYVNLYFMVNKNEIS